MIQDRLVINIQIQDQLLDIDHLQETDMIEMIEEIEIDTSPVSDLQEMVKDIVNVIEIVTEVNNDYFYIEKWTFKVMCEVYYQAKRIKKEAT